jgi:hypothetical protein
MARKHQETVPKGWTVQAVGERELRIAPAASWYWQNAAVALFLAIYFDCYPF